MCVYKYIYGHLRFFITHTQRALCAIGNPTHSVFVPLKLSLTNNMRLIVQQREL